MATKKSPTYPGVRAYAKSAKKLGAGVKKVFNKVANVGGDMIASRSLTKNLSDIDARIADNRRKKLVDTREMRRQLKAQGY